MTLSGQIVMRSPDLGAAAGEPHLSTYASNRGDVGRLGNWRHPCELGMEERVFSTPHWLACRNSEALRLEQHISAFAALLIYDDYVSALALIEANGLAESTI